MIVRFKNGKKKENWGIYNYCTKCMAQCSCGQWLGFALLSVIVKMGSAVIGVKCEYSDNFAIELGLEATVLLLKLTCSVASYNDILILASFSSRPTDPKCLTEQPEKQ